MTINILDGQINDVQCNWYVNNPGDPKRQVGYIGFTDAKELRLEFDSAFHMITDNERDFKNPPRFDFKYMDVEFHILKNRDRYLHIVIE